MAVSPIPKRKAAAVVAAENQTKKKKSSKKICISSKKEEAEVPIPPPPASSPRPQKRNSAPGVRVIGGRIYDPEHGKTCHQCRQKTMDFAARCKNIRQGDKPCTMHFCHKCLLNRYGEKAEEVVALDSWSCPKCRGICNCSFCMKKKGCEPTGILVHAAKATGFSSVLELLHHTGPEGSDVVKVVKDAHVSSGNPTDCSKKLKRKLNKNESNGCGRVLDQQMEASSGGNDNKENLNVETKKMSKNRKAKCAQPDGNEVLVESNTKEKKMKKSEGRKSKKHLDKSIKMEETVSIKMDSSMNGKTEGTSMEVLEKSMKKKKKMIEGNEGRESIKLLAKSFKMVEEMDRKTERTSVDVMEKPNKKKEINEKKKKVLESDGRNLGAFEIGVDADVNPISKDFRPRKCAAQIARKVFDADIVLPQGTVLTALAGIELPAEDVGPALQFLEFCAAFGKVIHIKKDQPELILRELSCGRIGRRPLNSPIVQFHIKLLCLIQKDAGDMSLSHSKNSCNSWLQALGNCISESQCSLKELAVDFCKEGTLGYENLDFSKKLKILNFLCDEILATADSRNWIDEENAKFVEGKKEANEKYFAAKEKEKHLRQKLRDDVAQAMISLRNGAPLTISEHHNLVSEIKAKTEEAREEMIGSMELLAKKKRRSNAVRTEPVLRDESGKGFWRLKAYCSCSHIVLQEIGNLDVHTSQDKWFIYDDEQEKAVDKHIYSIRRRSVKHKTLMKEAPECKNESVTDGSL